MPLAGIRRTRPCSAALAGRGSHARQSACRLRHRIMLRENPRQRASANFSPVLIAAITIRLRRLAIMWLEPSSAMRI